jgi:hypothetical protein
MPKRFDQPYLAKIAENPQKPASDVVKMLQLMERPESGQEPPSLSSVRRHRAVLDASPIYMGGRVRPTIAWATCYRQLLLKAPDVPAEQLAGLAELLRANADDDGESAAETRRQIGTWIKYRPWTEAGRASYFAAVEAKRIPQLRIPDLQAFTEGREGIVLWDELTKNGLYKWKRDVGFLQSARRKRARAARLKKKPRRV